MSGRDTGGCDGDTSGYQSTPGSVPCGPGDDVAEDERTEVLELMKYAEETIQLFKSREIKYWEAAGMRSSLFTSQIDEKVNLFSDKCVFSKTNTSAIGELHCTVLGDNDTDGIIIREAINCAISENNNSTLCANNSSPSSTSQLGSAANPADRILVSEDRQSHASKRPRIGDDGACGEVPHLDNYDGDCNLEMDNSLNYSRSENRDDGGDISNSSTSLVIRGDINVPLSPVASSQISKEANAVSILPANVSNSINTPVNMYEKRHYIPSMSIADGGGRRLSGILKVARDGTALPSDRATVDAVDIEKPDMGHMESDSAPISLPMPISELNRMPLGSAASGDNKVSGTLGAAISAMGNTSAGQIPKYVPQVQAVASNTVMSSSAVASFMSVNISTDLKKNGIAKDEGFVASSSSTAGSAISENHKKTGLLVKDDPLRWLQWPKGLSTIARLWTIPEASKLHSTRFGKIVYWTQNCHYSNFGSPEEALHNYNPSLRLSMWLSKNLNIPLFVLTFLEKEVFEDFQLVINANYKRDLDNLKTSKCTTSKISAALNSFQRKALIRVKVLSNYKKYLDTLNIPFVAFKLQSDDNNMAVDHYTQSLLDVSSATPGGIFALLADEGSIPVARSLSQLSMLSSNQGAIHGGFKPKAASKAFSAAIISFPRSYLPLENRNSNENVFMYGYNIMNITNKNTSSKTDMGFSDSSEDTRKIVKSYTDAANWDFDCTPLDKDIQAKVCIFSDEDGRENNLESNISSNSSKGAYVRLSKSIYDAYEYLNWNVIDRLLNLSSATPIIDFNVNPESFEVFAAASLVNSGEIAYAVDLPKESAGDGQALSYKRKKLCVEGFDHFYISNFVVSGVYEHNKLSLSSNSQSKSNGVSFDTLVDMYDYINSILTVGSISLLQLFLIYQKMVYLSIDLDITLSQVHAGGASSKAREDAKRGSVQEYYSSVTVYLLELILSFETSNAIILSAVENVINDYRANLNNTNSYAATAPAGSFKWIDMIPAKALLKIKSTQFVLKELNTNKNNAENPMSNIATNNKISHIENKTTSTNSTYAPFGNATYRGYLFPVQLRSGCTKDELFDHIQRKLLLYGLEPMSVLPFADYWLALLLFSLPSLELGITVAIKEIATHSIVTIENCPFSFARLISRLIIVIDKIDTKFRAGADIPSILIQLESECCQSLNINSMKNIIQ